MSTDHTLCTAADCDAPKFATCDNCGKVRCTEHLETCSTGEVFCDFACGGDGLACVRCKSEGCMVRRCVGELCWTCHRETQEVTL